MSALPRDGELRQVIGDLVHEGQLAFLDQRPHRRTGQHLGLAEQQEQVVVGRRHLGRFDLRVAIGAEQRKLAVPRERDLRAGIAAFLDVLLDQPIEVIERLRGEAETGGIAGRQRIFAWHCLVLLTLGPATMLRRAALAANRRMRFDPAEPRGGCDGDDRLHRTGQHGRADGRQPGKGRPSRHRLRHQCGRRAGAGVRRRAAGSSARRRRRAAPIWSSPCCLPASTCARSGCTRAD